MLRYDSYHLGPLRPGDGTVLGIDFGTVNVKLAVMASYSDTAWGKHCLIKPNLGVPARAAEALLVEAGERVGIDTPLRIGVTGSAASTIDEKDRFTTVNEVVAAAAMVGACIPQARTVIDLGGHLSKWIQVDPSHADIFSCVKDFALNGLCAAGSGAFMEQQAKRLDTDLGALGTLAMQAIRSATIAGRCSVFAKSDMIHLQQKGAPVDEIAYGLCLALARTFVSTVLQGRTPKTPIAFVGGGASNPGLIRAFGEVLHIRESERCIPVDHLFAGAMGAALGAVTGPELSIRRCLDLLASSNGRAQPQTVRSLARLKRPSVSSRGSAHAVSLAQQHNEQSIRVVLGIDVGSVSTNVVVLDEASTLLEQIYVPTAGKPIAALNRSFEQIKNTFGDRLDITAVGATGSGRHLAARIVGADVVKNEITAQLAAAVHYVPEVDTIFEIGGQDSKFIGAVRGRLKDFEMNKICAAGTGSFLEEQAERLGVSIRGEFADLAFNGAAPVDLGSRCTVFMDTELCRAMGEKAEVTDLCAGLAYAVARNYLEKVVAGREIGRTVVFQGGTSANAAVVGAFESILGRRIQVHPHGHVSGAIGAALLAGRQRPSAGTSFFGFDACAAYTVTSFVCDRCENRCQVNRVKAESRVAHFGDVCERYTVKDRGKRTTDTKIDSPPPDLFGERAALLEKHLPEMSSTSRPVVGLLRTGLSFELLPFWAGLLDDLGFTHRIAAPLLMAEENNGALLPQEVCLPLKLAGAQLSRLIDTLETESVLLPSVQHLWTRQEKDRPNTCLYAQYLPDMAKRIFGARVVTPQLCLSNDKSLKKEAIWEVARGLGASESAVRQAWTHATEIHEQFAKARQAAGKAVYESIPDFGLVVLGKPYNIHDPAANLNLAHHLRKLGVTAIPMDMLPLEREILPEPWYMLGWHLNRDQIRALQFAGNRSDLYPLHVSSYGCGPDAFALKHLESAWENRPRLFLEFDEHRGEAGLITRLEAFVDEIEDDRSQSKRRFSIRHPVSRENMGRNEGTRVFLPYTSPHVFAYAGVLESIGFDARVLSPPDSEIVRLGEEISSGKECHPFSIIAGDIVKLSTDGDLEGKEKFFLPTMRLPCLLSQYGDGLRKALKDLGETRLEIFDPHPGELNDIFGPMGFIRLYEGLTIIDVLMIAGCLLRPRETVKGDIDRALDSCFSMVETCLKNRTNVKRCLYDCLYRLEAVPLDEARSKPIIGVTGDLYTRTNAAGNASLFERLESEGCIVWPSPFFAASVDFEVPQDARRWATRGAYTRALQEGSIATILKMHSKRIVSMLPQNFKTRCVEPPYATLQRYAKAYTNDNSNHLIRGIVAKMVDFAERGADGVISAIGLGCMVGISASHAISAIREDHDDIPIISIMYGGKDGPAQQIQLETFLHQVRHRFAMKQERSNDRGISSVYLENEHRRTTR